MLWVIVLAPLCTLGSLAASVAVAGSRGACACALAGSSTALVSFMLHAALAHLMPSTVARGGAWFLLSGEPVEWALQITPWNQPVVGAVLLVSWAVVAYSGWYMAYDPHLGYFMALVQGFVFFMLCLLLADSMPLLFLGWEGIGVLSFFLISFWQTRSFAVQASMQGFVTNRAGDMAFMLALSITLGALATTNLDSLGTLDAEPRRLISCLLLGGAAGKSAQLGLHAWLPSAIEAPTPVSSLIHAATLVTAGVYLLVRVGGCTASNGGGAMVLSTATLLIAGTVGLSQTDLKRTIAFSTCSQVGYMVLGAGSGNPGSAIFLLLTHALYKALLFMCAGAVIHAAGNNQDARLMGAVGRLLPASKQLFSAASLALCAFPASAGDYSKDMLVEQMGYSYLLMHQTSWLGALAGTVLTGAYSARLLRLVYGSEPRQSVLAPAHEIPGTLLGVLTLLGVASYTSGSAGVELFVASMASVRPDALTHVMSGEQEPSPVVTLLPLLCAILGLVIGFQTSVGGAGSLSVLAYHQGRWDITLPRLSVAAELSASKGTSKTMDAGGWELVGPRGLALLLWPPLARLSSPYAQTAVYYTVVPLALLALLVVV